MKCWWVITSHEEIYTKCSLNTSMDTIIYIASYDLTLEGWPKGQLIYILLFPFLTFLCIVSGGHGHRHAWDDSQLAYSVYNCWFTLLQARCVTVLLLSFVKLLLILCTEPVASYLIVHWNGIVSLPEKCWCAGTCTCTLRTRTRIWTSLHIHCWLENQDLQ